MQCNLCPRSCGRDRDLGQVGYCQMPADIYIARASLHMWEEPCISGTEGSGTVFFSGCPLRCVFCQNRKIALGQIGKKISGQRLVEIFLELQDKGANNINLVTPTHYIPQIKQALIQAKEQGLIIPIVYNTSSYENVDSLKQLEGLVDVYLPDLKYKDSAIAARYSNAPDYFEVATKAIAEMVRQVGQPKFNDDGKIVKGVIVRHMILPGHTKDSKSVIEYLINTYHENIYVSIMNQYTPMTDMTGYDEINRRITKREYNKVIDHALELGLVNGFLQEGETAVESFIPEFDIFEGVDKDVR